MKKTNIILLLALSLIATNACKTNKNKSSDMKITFTELPPNGLEGNLTKGVSAAFAALINDKLIYAGGANFPDKLGFEGGAKVYYDEIMQFDERENRWKLIGKLPHPAAYGVSVVFNDKALWLGGNNDAQTLTSSYLISYSDSLKIESFPSLPAKMDNFAGCSIHNLVFVGGGNQDGKPSNDFYYIKAEKDKNWTKLPSFPGFPRVQPVMAALKSKDDTEVYVLGGFYGGDSINPPSVATDVLKYSFSKKEWTVVGTQKDNETNLPFSLVGATAMPVDNKFILCLGGVNYDIFLNAVSSQYDIANDKTITNEERSKKNYEFSKNYMTQPVEYYKFNQECRIFDIAAQSWITVATSEHTARAGATLVFNDKTFYNVQGELKPGVRSNQTWKGVITN